MTVRVIATEVSRLHKLAWRPGAEMHPDWWKQLGLAEWQGSYAYPACRSAIDRLIVARRGFPKTALPAQLDARQSTLLALEPRLDVFMIGLGILAHGRSDYLIAKPYRSSLAAHVSEQGCAQLLALCHGRPARGHDIDPNHLIDVMRDNGLRWWHADAGACIVTQLLTTVLPPALSPMPAAPEENMRDLASDWLLKIGRFL